MEQWNLEFVLTSSNLELATGSCNQRMNEIVDQMEDIAKVELYPRMAGRRMTMVLSPDKSKIQAYRQAHGNKTPEQTEDEVEEPKSSGNLMDAGEAAALMDAVEGTAPAVEETPTGTDAEATAEAEKTPEEG